MSQATLLVGKDADDMSSALGNLRYLGTLKPMGASSQPGSWAWLSLAAGADDSA